VCVRERERERVCVCVYVCARVCMCVFPMSLRTQFALANFISSRVSE